MVFYDFGFLGFGFTPVFSSSAIAFWRQLCTNVEGWSRTRGSFGGCGILVQYNLLRRVGVSSMESNSSGRTPVYLEISSRSIHDMDATFSTRNLQQVLREFQFNYLAIFSLRLKCCIGRTHIRYLPFGLEDLHHFEKVEEQSTALSMKPAIPPHTSNHDNVNSIHRF